MAVELAPAAEPRLAAPRRLSEHAWPNGTVPVVSIICATYNHEKFVAQCIEGFLLQEITFPVEIVVHDDASSDRTAEIIRTYDAMYPGLFRLILHAENQMRLGRNAMVLFATARGKFVAICEGDDYWTSPCKLQLQVDLLERHPDMALCHTLTAKVRTEDGATTLTELLPASEFRRTARADDLIGTNFISTPSVMFRQEWAPAMDARFLALRIGDWPLFYLLAERGPIGFIDSCTTAYRIHANNTFAGQSWELRVAQTAEASYFLATRAGKLRSHALSSRAEQLAIEAASREPGIARPARLFWKLFRQRPAGHFRGLGFALVVPLVYLRKLRRKLQLKKRLQSAFFGS